MDIKPNHIGIILDGNRRFAKHLMRRPWEGHKMGLLKSRDVLEWSCKAGIKYVTAYVLSLENFNTRPKRELRFILNYLSKEIDTILKDSKHVINKRKINVRFIGRKKILPKKLQDKFNDLEKATKKNKTHFLNIAVAYGGQQEIVDAVRNILKEGLKGIIKPSDLNEDLIKQHLYTNGHPFPDMIFRTGGERRISNFMLFQSAYSELIFTDRKWPELTNEDFSSALSEYSRRKRRFGK
ncbi:polyprenyl diphosphate synthase [Candidatus Aenigmatarchaeota archaeon]